MEQLLDYINKIGKVLETIHFGLIAEIVINLVILVLFSKAIDVLTTDLEKNLLRMIISR